jgi:hypothetical protein
LKYFLGQNGAGELVDNRRLKSGRIIGLKKRTTGVYGTDLD